MKKIAMLGLLLMLLPLAEAQFRDSIHDYMKGIDENYVIVVGDQGKSWDSVAATQLVVGLLKANRVNVQIKVEKDVSPNINKILIGHPCNNKMIKMSCDEWPFSAGEAVAKIIGNDLVIAGEDKDSMVNAAKMLSGYKKNNMLKKFKYALIKGDAITGLHEDFQIECGDGACEPGEKYLCNPDCQGVTCWDKCKELAFVNSTCKPDVVSATGRSCGMDEFEIGKNYCPSKNICCCIPERRQNSNQAEPTESSTPTVIPKEKGNDFKELLSANKGLMFVILILVVIVGVLVIFYKRLSF